MIRLVWCLALLHFNAGQNLRKCPRSDVHLEKIIGLRPPDSSKSMPLYKVDHGSRRPITIECISKCQDNDDCRSFVLDYSRLECYWYGEETDDLHESDYVLDGNISWFVKICLKAAKCDKSWVVERIPGATLIGNDTKKIPSKVTRSECQQHCLGEGSFACRSAKFAVDVDGANQDGEVRGACTLSDSDRHLLPNSYRVSSFDDEYFENQCADANQDDTSNDYCAYEEYENLLLAHADVLFEKKTKEECQNLCETFQSFSCRGFTVINGKTNRCLLHSEDSKIHGPKLLVANPNSTYYEKARCLHINVSCSDTYMSIQYRPELDFHGKLYMQGYSEKPECFARGQGRYTPIILKLPLLTSQCGIYKANSASNRTLLSGTLIIQYNALIQTQGDRVIRVGCIFGNESKVLIGTGVKITSSLPNRGSTLLNKSSNESTTPAVQMKILDINTGEEVSDTQIGQELQMIIELQNSNNNSYDIWASHLIAMTEKGEESIFLLDDRGCPTNLHIFPALNKVQTENGTQLVATFQAFKFASSPIVRFSVIVQFCPEECPPIACGSDIRSYGRKRREVKSQKIQTINGTQIVKVNRTDFESGKDHSSSINEMPLEYIMVVRDPKSRSDRLVWGSPNRILVAGYDYSTNEVCLDYSLIVGLLITWIIIQLIIFICCIVLVRRYKKHYQHECMKQSMEELHKNFGIGFSNLENRRVHWADNGEMM